MLSTSDGWRAVGCKVAWVHSSVRSSVLILNVGEVVITSFWSLAASSHLHSPGIRQDMVGEERLVLKAIFGVFSAQPSICHPYGLGMVQFLDSILE